MGLVTQSKQKKELQIAAISHKVKRTKLTFSDLVIPLASGVLFIILAFAVFIPMISAAFEYLDEIKVTEEKIEQLEKFNKQLDILDENQLNENLIVARKVIPRILKVSDFVYYIDSLAKEKGLEIKELSAGDTGSAASASGTGVSGPVQYGGDYENVISFLEDVQSISPYMIRLQNVEVGTRGEGEWTISLSVSGYYLLEDDKEPNIYAPFTSYMEYEDIVEIFKRKAENV